MISFDPPNAPTLHRYCRPHRRHFRLLPTALPATRDRAATVMAAASSQGVPTATLAAAAPPKPREEPEGMEEEAWLLEAFAALPSVARGWAFPAATHDGVRLTLQLQQRNLAANAQRRYLTSFLLNEAVLEAGALDASLPTEQQGVLLYAPSPSGRRLLIMRAGSNDSSTGGSELGRGAACLVARARSPFQLGRRQLRS